MRILVIEDERKIATALKRGLEQEAFAVDVAYDSDEGLAFALHEPYDVMIIDRMLPGEMEGLQICERVREVKIRTPILLLTARDKIGDRVAGLDAGADDYLIKPFAFEELLARLRALLRRPPDTADTTLTVGDVSLSSSTYEVKRGTKQLQLSSKEFALLEYLMRNVGRVLTKDNIIAHVWDYDAEVLPNTVEVYIGYLRQKLGDTEAKLIRTVRGFGYKMGES